MKSRHGVKREGGESGEGAWLCGVWGVMDGEDEMGKICPKRWEEDPGESTKK